MSTKKNQSTGAETITTPSNTNNTPNPGLDIFNVGDQGPLQESYAGNQTIPLVSTGTPGIDGPNQGDDKQTQPGEVLSQSNGLKPIVESPLVKVFDHETQFRNKTVILRPIIPKSRMGLENTPENYAVAPGGLFRFAPKRVGNMYRTGLNRPEMGDTPEEKIQRLNWLELQLGRKLDAEYYNEMSIPLDRNAPLGEKFFLWKAHDFVVFLAMLESDIVANGLHERQNGTKPYAEWYIENKEAEAEQQASAREQAFVVIGEFGKLSDQKKRAMCAMAGEDILGLTPLAVTNVLWKWLDENPKEKAKRHELFLFWLKRGDTFINVSAEVKNAIKFNVIRKNGAGDYVYGDAMLGANEEEVIGKLLKPQYADTRQGIQSKLRLNL